MLFQTALIALLPLVAAQGYGGGSSPTTAASSASSASTASAAAAAASQSGVHDVDVGKSGLVFSPDTLTAAVGDKVNFHFYPLNHSVVQSSFAAPCAPLQDGSTAGIYSGFMPVKSGEGSQMFTITINDTKPVWLYCSQTTGSHCQSGMVMAINAPSTGNTFDAYKAAAAKTNVSSSAAEVQGGILAANTDSDSSTASSSGSPSSSSGSGAATTSKPAGGYAPKSVAVSWAGLSVALVAGGWAWTLM